MAVLRIGFTLLAVVAALLGVSCGDSETRTIDSRRSHNYADALTKCLLFFEGQRSGKLPANQRLNWRKDSAVLDGQEIGVDLVGGYYDAGDNVKFGFPMAFSTTLISWSIIEFGSMMGTEKAHAMDAVRWATDYLLKATAEPNKIHVQVGDPYRDHNCWERPEDMDTPRTVYTVDPTKPGSEVAAETAAALAAASLVFRISDPDYAKLLLHRSMMVFNFAVKYKGSYSSSLGKWVCPFYCDFSGYEDELVWAAVWIHKASNSNWHWKYVINKINKLDQNTGEFGWDDKHAGVFVLLYNDLASDYIKRKTAEAVCTILPESPTREVTYSPGGLMFKQGGSNMQHPTSLSFLLLVYAGQLAQSSDPVVRCGDRVTASPSRLIEIAKGQVDYILGDNPLSMSYMVGYGYKFPQRIHHRGSSLPSLAQHPEHIPCEGGTPYFNSQRPNPNLLIGAIVGGPEFAKDDYADSRALFVQSEPTTYINAPMVGILAYFTNVSKAADMQSLMISP